MSPTPTFSRHYRRLLGSSFALTILALVATSFTSGVASLWSIYATAAFTLIYDITLSVMYKKWLRTYPVNIESGELPATPHPYATVAALACGIVLTLMWAAAFGLSVAILVISAMDPKDNGGLFIVSSLLGALFSAGIIGVTIARCRISDVERKRFQGGQFVRMGDVAG